MQNALNKLSTGLTTLLALCLSISLEGANTTTWLGATNDLTVAGNWSTAVPDASYIATFGAAGATDPTLSELTLSPLLAVGQIEFAAGAQEYDFQIGSFSNDVVSFNLGGSPSISPSSTPTGILNNSGALQIFNIAGTMPSRSNMNFLNLSSADIGNTGLVVYNVGEESGQTGLLTFQNSSNAGHAVLNIVGGVGTNAGGNVQFQGLSSAASSIIFLGEAINNTKGSLLFLNNSKAGIAAITASQASAIIFNDLSNAENATIKLGNMSGTAGSLFFNNGSGAGASIITATDGSEISFAGGSNAQAAEINLENNASLLTFREGASAGVARILTKDATSTSFNQHSTADNANITVEGIAVKGALTFNDASSAGDATILLLGMAETNFHDSSNARNATFLATNNSVTNFNDQSNAGDASFNLSDNSTINFNDASSSGEANFSLDSSATLNLLQNQNAVFNAHLFGEGTIRKLNSDSLVTFVSDNANFGGLTVIEEGSVRLDNNLGGKVNVGQNGTLLGTGTVVGKLDVAGVISPGNSIGTMHVNGSYIQQGTSTYQVEVNSEGLTDLINVQGTPGTAVIEAGATVAILPIDVSQLTPDETFSEVILHADGGLVGTYSTITTANPLLTAELSYTPNDVILTFENTLALIGSTHNQRAVARQLQTITSPNGDEETLLLVMATLPLETAQKALDQMSAAQYTYTLFNAQQATQRFIRRLYDPIREITTQDPCHVSPYSCCSPCETWLDGSYIGCTMNNRHSVKGFIDNGYEISLGVHNRLDPCWTVGVAGSYQQNRIEYRLNGTGLSRTGLGAIYALYRPTNFYVLSDLILGYTSEKIHRHVSVGNNFFFKKHGRAETFQSALYVETGFDCWCECLLIQPFFGIEGGYYHRNRIREKSRNQLLDVRVSEKSRGTADSRLGLHFKGEWMSCVFMDFDATWQYRLTPLENQIEERFRTFGNKFDVEGIYWGRNSFDTGLNLSFLLCDCVEFYTEANGQFWKRAASYSITGGLKISW